MIEMLRSIKRFIINRIEGIRYYIVILTIEERCDILKIISDNWSNFLYAL